MRKLLVAILLSLTFTCLLQGCRKHVYSTYYGVIDIDTITHIEHWEDKTWYRVRYSLKDSFNWNGTWKFIFGPIEDYYCPATNKYIETMPDNQGRIVIIDIDPYHDMDWLNN